MKDAGWQTEAEAALSAAPVGIFFAQISGSESLRPVLWTAVALQTSGELNQKRPSITCNKDDSIVPNHVNTDKDQIMFKTTTNFRKVCVNIP